jgi:hypothetical protein
MMVLVSRAGWRAKPPHDPPIKLPWSAIDTAVVHYTASFADEFPDYKERVRNIQAFHMNRADPEHGWNDIAYNFLFARDGTIYEGRGWNVMSAATLGHNSHTVAFCFLGSDKTGRDDVTDAGRKALRMLLFTADGFAKKKLLVKGHKDFVGTDCPGNELYSYINTGWWKVTETVNYPPKFFQWAAWRLGEGPYKQYGPKKGPRPKVPMPVTPIYWYYWKIFMDNRKKAILAKLQ